jgi:membrane-associated phospholipid phosphatase
VFRVFHGVICVSLLIGSTVQGQTADTITTSNKPLFVFHDLAMAGAFTLGTIALAPLDRHFTHQLQKPARQSSRLLSTSATIFRLLGQPGSILTGVGIYLIGRADGQRRTEDLGLHTTEAVVLGSAEAGIIKMLAGRARPYASEDNARNFGLFRGLKDDAYRSFPSGHSTSAFAFAATVSSETQRWWPGTRWIIGPILYGGATLTGVSRIYNKAHWASDVMAGAALGTFTGIKVVRYQHSHPGNWIDRKFLRAGVSIANNGSWMPIISTVSY